MTRKFDGKKGPDRPKRSYLTSLKQWLSYSQREHYHPSNASRELTWRNSQHDHQRTRHGNGRLLTTTTTRSGRCVRSVSCVSCVCCVTPVTSAALRASRLMETPLRPCMTKLRFQHAAWKIDLHVPNIVACVF